MLYHIGFGCRQEDDVLRVGPFLTSDKITKDQVRQMDNYMLRTWVELSIYLAAFRARNGVSMVVFSMLTPGIPSSGENWVTAQSLEDVLGEKLSLHMYPKRESSPRICL